MYKCSRKIDFLPHAEREHRNPPVRKGVHAKSFNHVVNLCLEAVGPV